MSQIVTVLSVLILVTAFQNCGSSDLRSAPISPAQKVSDSDLDLLESEIRNLNDSDLSCQQDSQCVVMYYGSRSCGGRANFLISSTASANFSRLPALIQEFERKEFLHAASLPPGTVGVCGYPDYNENIPPKCVQNTCVSGY